MEKIVTLLFLWGTVAVSNADIVKTHPYPPSEAYGPPSVLYGTPVDVVKFEQKPIIVPPAPELEPIVSVALPELPLHISTYVDGGRVVTSTGKHVLPVIPPAPELSPFLSHFTDNAGYSKFPNPISFAIATDEKYKHLPQAPVVPAVQELLTKFLSEGKLFTNKNAIELLAKNGVIVLNHSKDAKLSSSFLTNLVSPVVISLCQQFLANQASSSINNVSQLPPSSDVIVEPVPILPENPPVTVVVPSPPEIPTRIFDETPVEVLAPYPPAVVPVIPPAPEIVEVRPPSEIVVETNPLIVPPPPELPLAELPDIPSRIVVKEPVISAPYPPAIGPVIPPAPELIEVKPALPIPFVESNYPPKPLFVPQPPELPPLELPQIPIEIAEKPVKVLPYPPAIPVIPPAPELVNSPPGSVPEYPPIFKIKVSDVFRPINLGVIPPAPELPTKPLPVVPEQVLFIQKPKFLRERINIPQAPQLPSIPLPEIPTRVLVQEPSRIILIPNPPEYPHLPIPEYVPQRSIDIVPGPPATVYGPPAKIYGPPF